MDDIYTNLENYDEFNKLEELKNENKTLKFKIEEYTSAINKLQKDFETLAVEHKKLELNYSSLLKTAKEEIERKTLLIKELNLEKDKLIINARQNNAKPKFNKFQKDRFNTTGNKSSDTSSVQEPLQKLPNTQAALNEYKSNNSSPLDTTSTCSGDTRNINDAIRFANKEIRNDSRSCVSKENSVQVPNKVPNKETDTKVKKIMNRRKSMPPSSCREVNYSTDDEHESSVTTKTSKTQHPARDERKRSTDKHSHYKAYDSSLENNYAHYQEQMSSRNKSYYNDSNYRSKDSYDSSQRRHWNVSPERSHRSGRDNPDNYYQAYKRRAYDSPPRDRSHHHSRLDDRRSSYRRDRSRDYSRSNYDKERYAEKHRLKDDLDEPNNKRQKYEYSHRYSEDEGRHRASSANKSALPMLLENAVSCQSPDYIHPDSHISVAPMREIRSTAVMNLEDPRLSSKKYMIITHCDKEVLTTANGRNVDIIPVNKKLWRFSPIPIPKALIEPPSSYIDTMTKSFNMDYYSSYNYDSNEISDRPTNGEYYPRTEYSGLEYPTPNNKSKDVIANSTTPNYKETQCKNSISDTATVDMEIEPQSVNEKNNVSVAFKHLNCGYKIPKKINNSEVSKSTDSNNKMSNQGSWEKCPGLSQKISQSVEPISRLSDNIKSNYFRDTQKVNKSTEKRLTEDEDAEKFIENRNYELALSRKLVESDLTLSDDTSDNFEPPHTIINSQTKYNCKKYKTKERSKNNKGTIESKKSENASKFLPDVNTVESKNKRPPEDDKCKHKEEYSEHSKKHKHKKKSPEGKEEWDDAKTSKFNKAKKEKETKPEVKTKFSEFFGDSNSLITCDDLGVVPQDTVHRPNFVTIIEDHTQDAVDIDIKEMGKLQAAKLQPDIHNEAMEVQAAKQTDLTNMTDGDTKKCDDLKISIRKTEDNYTIVHEATEPLNKNTNAAISNMPDTIIISTGIQQQNVYNDEFRQPMNVTCMEKVQSLSPGLALATSTPAKIQEMHKDIQSDCSSVSSSDGVPIKVQKNKKSDTECQKESDVPDVRIFVKRRRKAKK